MDSNKKIFEGALVRPKEMDGEINNIQEQGGRGSYSPPLAKYRLGPCVQVSGIAQVICFLNSQHFKRNVNLKSVKRSARAISQPNKNINISYRIFILLH